MFRILDRDQKAEDQHDALISADFQYSRLKKAFDELARGERSIPAGDKNEELPTTVTDAARIGVCD
jgi:hypothetical protein